MCHGTLPGTLPDSVLSVNCRALNGRKCVGGSQTVTKLGLCFSFFLFCEGLQLTGFCMFFCGYHIVC